CSRTAAAPTARRDRPPPAPPRCARSRTGRRSSGAAGAAEIAVIGDEETVAAEVRRYREAGATEVVFTATELNGEDDRVRTWNLLGELSRG
ncbi:hypothetical protein ABZY16_21520, partial [Streptomyces sp. NPDC006553]